MIQKKIEYWVSKGKLLKALAVMRTHVDLYKQEVDQAYRTSLIMFDSKYHRAKQASSMGIISRKDFEVEVAQLNLSLLTLARDFDTDPAVIELEHDLWSKEEVELKISEDRIDHILKGLIYFIGLLCALGVVYSSFLQENLDRLVLISLSLLGLIGCFGVFYYWKLTEIRSLQRAAN